MAGVNVGTAWVTIAASAKGIGKGIEKDLKGAGTRAGTQFGTEFDKSASKATTSLSSFGTAAIVGAVAVGAAFFGLASASGNLSAAIAANEQVLGDASQAVQDFAETGVESVGLSEIAILSAATTFGQLGKVIGLTGTDLSTFSTDLVVLAADMAAFKNVTPTQALEDLQSAFAGQPEVLRKYGVFLDDATLKTAYFDETGIRVSGTLTAQQRLIATNAELWRQTADIQGQAAREADGLERSVADLKAVVSNVAADFGKPIVGFASGLLDTITGGLGTLGSWNEETGGMLATGLAAGVGILAIGGAAAGIAGKLKDAAEKFGGLSRGMKAATLITGGLALGVTAGFIAYGLMTAHSKEVAARTAEVAGAMDQATTDAWEYAEAASAAAGDIDGIAVAQQALGTAITSTSPEITDAFGKLGIQLDDVGAHLLAIGEDPLEGMRAIGLEAGATTAEARVLAMVFAELGSRSNDFVTDDASSLAGAIFEVGEGMGITREEAILLGESLLPVAQNMEEAFDAANPEQLNDIAEATLTAAVSNSQYGESLVEMAEDQSGASAAGDDAFLVYLKLNEILGEMTPTERAAALEALGFADAQTEAAAAGETLNEVAASSIDLTTDLEDSLAAAAGEADAFNSAIDRLVGGQLSLQEANDELMGGIAELNEQIRKAQEGEEGYELSLSDTTAAGRENREMIRSRVTDILGMAAAELEAGHSVDIASRSMSDQRDVLIAQILPFFETRQAAEDYINTLELTPEAITTAVELAQEEQAKAEVADYLATLENIPEGVRTNVDALVDAGSFELALRQLEQLEKNRYARVFVSTSTGGARNSGGQLVGAYGGYVPANSYQDWLLGEAPWDEAILTVGNIPNLRTQLQDDRIGGPILDALPRVDPMNDSGGRRVREGDVNLISYEQNPTPGGIATAIGFARR